MSMDEMVKLMFQDVYFVLKLYYDNAGIYRLLNRYYTLITVTLIKIRKIGESFL